MRATGRTAILQLRAGTQARSKGLWESWAPIDGTRAPVATWAEDARAARGASAIADAWALRFHEAAEDDLTIAQAAKRAAAAIAQNIERTAITETAQAFNSEILRQNTYAHALGYAVEETWSALLDACPRCWELDGLTVTLPDRLPDSPPLHPRCRCTIVTNIGLRDAEAA
jgi:Phage Mu protein F like protein